MFGNDLRQKKDLEMMTKNAESLIWGEKEYEYFEKLKTLQAKPTFALVEFERTVDELKRCVTQHLWHVAVEEVQLVNRLKMIKDFYLMGQGDMFLKFIRLATHILDKSPTNHTSRDINLAFQMALRKTQTTDETALESFTFAVPTLPVNKDDATTEMKEQSTADSAEFSEKEKEDPIDKRGWCLIILKYKVTWPLHLLFNPSTLRNYNTLFIFLLRVKNTQINLWNLWRDHMNSKNIDIDVMQLRNKLIFIVDNLQYYLQVDVIESQYTIMENTMKNTRNLEDVQKAHAIFLANIMSCTFLMSGGRADKRNPLDDMYCWMPKDVSAVLPQRYTEGSSSETIRSLEKENTRLRNEILRLRELLRKSEEKKQSRCTQTTPEKDLIISDSNDSSLSIDKETRILDHALEKPTDFSDRETPNSSEISPICSNITRSFTAIEDLRNDASTIIKKPLKLDCSLTLDTVDENAQVNEDISTIDMKIVNKTTHSMFDNDIIKSTHISSLHKRKSSKDIMLSPKLSPLLEPPFLMLEMIEPPPPSSLPLMSSTVSSQALLPQIPESIDSAASISSPAAMLEVTTSSQIPSPSILFETSGSPISPLSLPLPELLNSSSSSLSQMPQVLALASPATPRMAGDLLPVPIMSRIMEESPQQPPPPPRMPGITSGPPPPSLPMPGTADGSSAQPPISGIVDGPPPPPPMPGIAGSPPPPTPMPGIAGSPLPPPIPGIAGGPPPPPLMLRIAGSPSPPPPMPGIAGGLPPSPPMPGIAGGPPPPPPMPGVIGSPPPPPMPGGPTPPPPAPGMSNSHFTGPSSLPPPPIGGWNPPIRALMRKEPVIPEVPMKPLYWTRIIVPVQTQLDMPDSDASAKNLLWLELDEEKNLNLQEFTELFSRQVIERKPTIKLNLSKPKNIEPAKILDSKRSKMVGILEKSLHVDFIEVEKAIYTLDTSIVSLDALQQIYTVRPTAKELEDISTHERECPNVPLDSPELFLKKLSNIKFFSERLTCLMFQAEFTDAISSVSAKLTNLRSVCEFMLNSNSLKRVIALILTLGNYMNGGNRMRGQADGFGLEILGKLKDVKSKVIGVTLLHYVVKTRLAQEGDYNFNEPLPLPIPEPTDVQAASTVNFEDLGKELDRLERRVQDCITKCKTVEEGNPENAEPFKIKMDTFLTSAHEELVNEVYGFQDAKTKFKEVMQFYQYIPKGFTLDTAEPKDFFILWVSFCKDFKDIWKKEQQLLKKIDDAKAKYKTQRKPEVKKKEGGLKPVYRS